ncbi:MAG: hypothetical protein WC740_09450 [Verrucomicrobiia bacterium]
MKNERNKGQAGNVTPIRDEHVHCQHEKNRNLPGSLWSGTCAGKVMFAQQVFLFHGSGWIACTGFSAISTGESWSGSCSNVTLPP